MKEKGFCEICSKVIEITKCCNLPDCGCGGLPVEPPVCSEKCYNLYMSKKDDPELDLLFINKDKD